MAFQPLYPHLINVSPTIPEYRTSVWEKGGLVYVNAGYLTICGGDPALIYGVAIRSGQNGASDGTYSTEVYMLDPDSLYIGKSNTTTALTQVGVAYGVVLSGTEWLVDISDTQNTRVRVIALDPRDVVGLSGGRYYVRFVQGNIQTF